MITRPWLDYPGQITSALESGQLPDDVSLWVAVTGPDGEADPLFEPVFLRRTMRGDGRGGEGHVRSTAFNLLGTDRMVQFQLVFHPLHDLSHPFSEAGMVTRLWPDPPSELDLSTHPVLDSITRLSQVFLDSGLSHGLGAGQHSVGNGSPWEEW